MPSNIIRKVVAGAVAEGEFVRITIGGADLVMTYVDALRFSQLIRVAGKQAKLNAGDMSRSWSVVAQLEPQQTKFRTGG